MGRWACLGLWLAITLQWASGVAADEHVLEPVQVLGTPVKLITLRSYDIATAPRFPGRMEAGDSAELAFRVAGQLRSLNVTMGDAVDKGAVLAELDPTDYQLRLEVRAAEFELARLGAERAATLFTRKLISEDQFDTSQTLLATRKARLEQASEQLSFCKLLAPFTGDIAFTYAMPSEIVASHQPVLTLQDTTKLDIHFNLPPRYQPLLNGAEKATFQVEFDLLPGVLLPAEYKEVHLQPDPDTNSYPMTLVLERPDNLTPRPGMSVEVRLHHPSLFTGSWILPADALFERSEKAAYVWRVDENTMTIRKTAIALDQGGVVTEGLQSGDRIVAAGVTRLTEGQKVRAWVREGGL